MTADVRERWRWPCRRPTCRRRHRLCRDGHHRHNSCWGNRGGDHPWRWGHQLSLRNPTRMRRRRGPGRGSGRHAEDGGKTVGWWRFEATARHTGTLGARETQVTALRDGLWTMGRAGIPMWTSGSGPRQSGTRDSADPPLKSVGPAEWSCASKWKSTGDYDKAKRTPATTPSIVRTPISARRRDVKAKPPTESFGELGRR